MPSYRAYLEVCAASGEGSVFMPAEQVVVSQELQKRCIEKKAMRHAKRLIQAHRPHLRVVPNEL